MGFTKTANVWTIGSVGGVATGGANDHKVCPSGENQEDKGKPTTEQMEIVPYNPLEDNPMYSHFERLVLHQVHELNVSQNELHTFCKKRFHELDDQIHGIHDLLTLF